MAGESDLVTFDYDPADQAICAGLPSQFRDAGKAQAVLEDGSQFLQMYPRRWHLADGSESAWEEYLKPPTDIATGVMKSGSEAGGLTFDRTAPATHPHCPTRL
jgi:hypothetical protein